MAGAENLIQVSILTCLLEQSLEIRSVSKEASRNISFYFSLTRQPKNLKIMFACMYRNYKFNIAQKYSYRDQVHFRTVLKIGSTQKRGNDGSGSGSDGSQKHI
jgi:hypothetical protein